MNSGIGMLLATFKTALMLSEKDIGSALTIHGPNIVAFGPYRWPLLGRLESVSGRMVSVQIAGVMELRKSLERPPVLGFPVCVDASGAVQYKRKGRGMVVAVYDDMCEVLL